MTLHDETTPNWLQEGVRTLQSNDPSADPREPTPLFEPPLEKMISQLQQMLDKANARCAGDYPEADHPYACLAGAREGDLINLTNTIESYLAVYGIEGLKQ